MLSGAWSASAGRREGRLAVSAGRLTRAGMTPCCRDASESRFIRCDSVCGAGVGERLQSMRYSGLATMLHSGSVCGWSFSLGHVGILSKVVSERKV